VYNSKAGYTRSKLCAYKQWSHGKMNSSLNSSPRFVDLTSCLLFWKPLTVHRLVDHVHIKRFPRMTATVTRLALYTDLNAVGLLQRPFLRQTAFTNMKYSSIFHSRTLPQTIIKSATTTSGFIHRLSPTANLSVQISHAEQLYYHVTLVMFQLFRFLEIFICSASKAR